MAKRDDELKLWIEARKRHKLSHAHIRMARELGLNPKKFGKIDNRKQEPWKAPLPRYIEDLYFKRFGKERPGDIRPIEAVFKEKLEKERRKKEVKRKLKAGPEGPRRVASIPVNGDKPDPSRHGPRDTDDPEGRWALFDAEASYAESIMRSALGDVDGSIAMLEEVLASVPGYVPALYSMGTARYFQGAKDECRRLFQAILDSPADTPDLLKFIDHAGDFLIERKAYDDGLDYYRKASARFPDHAVFHQGMSCCAGHLGLRAEELAAARRALELEPDNQKLVNDLGWSLYQGGDLSAARETLERAVTMDSSDELARENLRIVAEAVAAGSDASGGRGRSEGATADAPAKPKRRARRRQAPEDHPTLF